jgi:hypothetical protein
MFVMATPPYVGAFSVLAATDVDDMARKTSAPRAAVYACEMDAVPDVEVKTDPVVAPYVMVEPGGATTSTEAALFHTTPETDCPTAPSVVVTFLVLRTAATLVVRTDPTRCVYPVGVALMVPTLFTASP